MRLLFTIGLKLGFGVDTVNQNVGQTFAYVTIQELLLVVHADFQALLLRHVVSYVLEQVSAHQFVVCTQVQDTQLGQLADGIGHYAVSAEAEITIDATRPLSSNCTPGW